MSGLSAVHEARARREARAAHSATVAVVAPSATREAVEQRALNSAEFLAEVLPDHGKLCLFLLPEARHLWVSSTGELAELVEKYRNRKGVYFGTAAFGAGTKREQTNVVGVKAFRLDIDAGSAKLAKHGESAVYATQREALEDLQRFTTETGLVPRIVVSSGEGLHVYYVLRDCCTPQDWQPVADALKDACKALGLRTDPSVTADSARILRPLGTLHTNGKRVEVLEVSGKVYTLDEFAGKLGKGNADSLDRAARAYDLSLNADVLTQHDNTPADFELIRTGCEAVRWAADTTSQPSVQEPYWRSLLGIVKFCAGAEGLAHDVSRHHPDYDRQVTARKLSAWNAGPTTCAEFGNHSTACAGCKYSGKVKSPIVLGKVNTPEIHGSTATGLAAVVAAGGLYPIVDQDGVLNYVETYQKSGRNCRQVFKAGTGAATDLILTTAAASGSKPPSQQAISVFEAQLRTKAKRSGDVTPVSIRVAQGGETRFVDLGPGRIVRITPQGWTQVDESAEVPLFRRGAGAGELPDPIPFEADARAALAHLVRHFREMFQTPSEQAVLRAAVALDRLDPETTHPVCEYVGSAGSGKSTAAEHDIAIIDPPSKGGLRTCGFKTEDIAAAAQQQFVLAMDNVSRLEKSTGDTLCMCSTGGTLAVRKLYEQAETAALHLLRPVSITAVSPVCTQPDLQTRTLRFEFRATPNGEIISEVEIRAATAARLPALLGALYTLKAATLRAMPEVRLRKGWKHRLITFDQTGEAMLAAAGYPPGGFLKIVGTLRESMARRSASGDVFLLKVCAALNMVQSWSKDEVEPSLRQLMTRPRPAAVFEATGGTRALMRPSILLGLLPRPDPWDRDSPIPKTERALMDAPRAANAAQHGRFVQRVPIWHPSGTPF